MYYAIFDEAGLPRAFYSDEVHGARVRPIYGEAEGDEPRPIIGEEPNLDCMIPADAVEITEAQWRDFIENTGRRRWNGSDVEPYEPPPAPSPVPAVISDRQFAQQLAVLGTITEAEALAWAARGELPDAMEAAIAALPESDRFGARMLLASATTYERAHPLVAQLGALLEYDAADLDDLWRAAGEL